MVELVETTAGRACRDPACEIPASAGMTKEPVTGGDAGVRANSAAEPAKPVRLTRAGRAAVPLRGKRLIQNGLEKQALDQREGSRQARPTGRVSTGSTNGKGLDELDQRDGSRRARPTGWVSTSWPWPTDRLGAGCA
ncbi:protein of unknown function [Micropruina glycogenica]|uniref:Uncharacterized protein n=1 Tax=Micropruina glycogenica TaxID=75385 RepID=A0A2N9JAI1_9ACTN|nr:protein of unknown function [Micropruina glycogenica]